MPRTPRKPKPKSIHVAGRRWFSTNTYHVSRVYVNGQHVYTSPVTYGYGEQFVQTAEEWLEKNGYLPGLKHYSHGGTEPLWRYCQDRGIAYEVDVVDVTRKKDL